MSATSGPTPSRSATPGRNTSKNASACSISRSERLDAVGLLQVDGDGLLAAVHGAGRRLRVVDRPGGVDPVDPEHLGAHVGEEHPAERPGPEPDHLHGSQPLERTRH